MLSVRKRMDTNMVRGMPREGFEPSYSIRVSDFESDAYTIPPSGPGRCDGCGKFLKKNSYYSNRCDDCWSPQDEFGIYPVYS